MRSKLRQDSPMEVYPVRLTAAHALKARRVGIGNLSDGVRILIEAGDEPQTNTKCGIKPQEVAQSSRLADST